MTITISAIIPAYNCEETLGRALDSMLNQTCPPNEIIVVNDGSTDDTFHTIENYAKKHRIIHAVSQENAGPAIARNRGAKIAKGGWLSFLDSDDFWYPCHLENLTNVVKEHPEVSWAAAAFKTERNLTTAKAFSQNVLPSYLAIAHNRSRPVNSNSVIIRRSVFQECGGFREDWRNEEDNWLWFQLGLLYPQLGYSPVLSSFRTDRPGSLSKQENSHKETLRRIVYNTDQMIEDAKAKNLFDRKDVQLYFGERISKVLLCSLFVSYHEYQKLRDKYHPFIMINTFQLRTHLFIWLSKLGLSIPHVNNTAVRLRSCLQRLIIAPQSKVTAKPIVKI